MIDKVHGLFRSLKRCVSGNATLLVAMGLPVLIGGTGFAVDTAQWYLWKRELQYATDQAAIGAAWALTDDDTAGTYQARGTQEYNNNLATTEADASVPQFQLADFGGGDDNSVIVRASMTRTLPFSSLLTGEGTTISVYAQAQFEEGAEFTSCLVAVDEDDDGAITVGGNSVLTAGCGMAALSTSDNSITVNGDPEIDAGWIISAGGIDDWFDTNTDDTVMEYQDGLYDPFEDLTPPDNPTPRELTCPQGNEGNPTSTQASVTTETSSTYDYFIGPSRNNSEPYNYSGAKPDASSTAGPETMIVPDGTVAGTTTDTEESWFNVAGSGANKVWELTTTTQTVTYADVVIVQGNNVATALPGTYQDFTIQCDTVLAGGIYVIEGGELNINAQDTVTGAGVMFVLKDGAGLQINGGSSVNLTAMTVAELLAAGVSAEAASELAGMLIFEDRESEGNEHNMINGTALTVLNGTIYLPNSNLDFAGTAAVTSQCLMIASATITLTGTANMTTFCPSGVSSDTTVASFDGTVRLVA